MPQPKPKNDNAEQGTHHEKRDKGGTHAFIPYEYIERMRAAGLQGEGLVFGYVMITQLNEAGQLATAWNSTAKQMTPKSQKELATYAGVSEKTASRTVAKLRKAGYIREVWAHDPKRSLPAQWDFTPLLTGKRIKVPKDDRPGGHRPRRGRAAWAQAYSDEVNAAVTAARPTSKVLPQRRRPGAS